MNPSGPAGRRPGAISALALFVCAVWLGPGPAAAEPSPSISGQVRDAAGSPLSGATVEVWPEGRAPAALSDAEGRYVFVALPPGTYEVHFRVPGFATAVRRGVFVAGGATTTVDAVLLLNMSTQVVVTSRATFRDLSQVGSEADLLGVATAASSGFVPATRLQDHALRRPADVLERVPGVVISQHSGEGKANQYYVRGFNIDHGTDLAVSVGGVPVNMPTHAHGQGYADANFLIPELIGALRFEKGPYHAEQGDFSAAGAIDAAYVTELERPLATLQGGEDGYRRALLAASPRLGAGHLLLAGELARNDGPWERSDDLRKLSGVVRYSQGTARDGFNMTGLFYDADWNSTDQVPQRAVASGLIGRFGNLDASDGGETHRHSLSAEWQRATPRSLTHVTAYGLDYRLDLFSNFTYCLDDPENGDQFEQLDDRTVLGMKASHLRTGRVLGRDVEWTGGLQLRRDDIGRVALFHTRGRQRLSAVRDDSVVQSSAGLYGQSSVQWSPVVRIVAGARLDAYRFSVDSSEPRNSGDADATKLSPKLGFVFGPWNRTELFANAGFGFHSNDARGSTITVDPATGEPASRVDPLVRAKGAELGLRTMALSNVHATATLWWLDLDSELLFVGDAGTTEASRPSRRLGVELAAELAPASWLSVDASAALSRARFRDVDPAGERIPGAVAAVLAAGASVDYKDWLASGRVRYFGPRPLIEDDSVRSPSSTLVELQLGRRIGKRLTARIDVLNLFDARVSDVDYFYASRLPGEALQGVEDIHTHPVEPRSIRFGITATF